MHRASIALADAGDLVNADVVHDDDVSALEHWKVNLFDIGQEAWAIHRPIQQQRGRGHAVGRRQKLRFSNNHLAPCRPPRRRSTYRCGEIALLHPSCRRAGSSKCTAFHRIDVRREVTVR